MNEASQNTPASIATTDAAAVAGPASHDSHGSGTTAFNLNRKIFVGNISYRIGSRRLTRFFSKFGAVETCYIVKDHLKRWSKGTAFITFKTEESMRKALQASGEQLILDQREMRVQPAEISHKATYWQPSDSVGGNMLDVSQNAPDWQLTDSGDGNMAVTENWDETVANGNEDDVTHRSATDTDPVTANIDSLFNELLLGIFLRLSVRERIAVERVCWRWRRLVQRSWHTQRHLHFQNCFRRFEGLTDKILNSLLSKCGPYLQSLDLSASPRLLTDFAMDIIGKHCPDIMKLDLTNIKVTDISMSNLSKKCKQLQWVRLRGCCFLEDKGVEVLLQSNLDLRYLDVSDIYNCTGKCFRHAGEKTEAVVATNCHQDKGVCRLARRVANLQELNVSHCHQLSNIAVQTICQNFTQLKRLNISGTMTKVTCGALCDIQNLTQLEELVVSFNPALNDNVLIAVATACMQLRVLDISGCHRGVSDTGVTSLRNLTMLHTLNLSYLSQVTEASIVTLSHNLKVRKLVARATKFMTDKAVISLVTLCPDLEHLDVSGCFQLTNDIFQAFNDSPVDANRTVQLFLGGTSVDWVSEDIDWVRGFSHLQVSMHNLAMEQLRPDRDLMMPADDFDEEDNEYDIHPPLSDFEVGDVEECRDWEDEVGEDYDEFLENDDPLAEERWEFS